MCSQSAASLPDARVETCVAVPRSPQQLGLQASTRSLRAFGMGAAAAVPETAPIVSLVKVLTADACQVAVSIKRNSDEGRKRSSSKRQKTPRGFVDSPAAPACPQPHRARSQYCRCQVKLHTDRRRAVLCVNVEHVLEQPGRDRPPQGDEFMAAYVADGAQAIAQHLGSLRATGRDGVSPLVLSQIFMGTELRAGSLTSRRRPVARSAPHAWRGRRCRPRGTGTARQRSAQRSSWPPPASATPGAQGRRWLAGWVRRHA